MHLSRNEMNHLCSIDACCLDSSDLKKDIEASQLYQEGIKLQCSHKDFSRAASSDSISSLQSQVSFFILELLNSLKALQRTY